MCNLITLVSLSLTLLFCLYKVMRLKVFLFITGSNVTCINVVFCLHIKKYTGTLFIWALTKFRCDIFVGSTWFNGNTMQGCN